MYVIRPDGREKPLRTLHQNNLCVQPSSWRSGAHGGVGELAGSQPTVPPEAERGPERGWWPVCFPCEQGRPEPRENLRGAREVGEALAEAGVNSGDAPGPRRSQRPLIKWEGVSHVSQGELWLFTDLCSHVFVV